MHLTSFWSPLSCYICCKPVCTQTTTSKKVCRQDRGCTKVVYNTTLQIMEKNGWSPHSSVFQFQTCPWRWSQWTIPKLEFSWLECTSFKLSSQLLLLGPAEAEAISSQALSGSDLAAEFWICDFWFNEETGSDVPYKALEGQRKPWRDICADECLPVSWFWIFMGISGMNYSQLRDHICIIQKLFHNFSQ